MERRKVKIISDRNQWIEGKNTAPGDSAMCDRLDAQYLVGRGRAHYPSKGKAESDELPHVSHKSMSKRMT